MKRATEIVLAAASMLLGAMWLFAAATKIVAPMTPYEFLARATAPGAAAKSVFIVGVTAEALLGGAMLLRAVGSIRGLALSLAAFACAEATLLVVQGKGGPLMPCGCYGEAFMVTIEDELRRNAWIAGALVVLIAWGALAARRPPPRSA